MVRGSRFKLARRKGGVARCSGDPKERAVDGAEKGDDLTGRVVVLERAIGKKKGKEKGKSESLEAAVKLRRRFGIRKPRNALTCRATKMITARAFPTSCNQRFDTTTTFLCRCARSRRLRGLGYRIGRKGG